MEAFTTEAFTATLALVGVVILISALLSGLIERSGLPQVAILLGLGAALGPAGLGMLDVPLESPFLRVVATLSLALVLFTDALTLDINEVRRHGQLAVLVLGPGTLLSAVLIALAGWWLLGLAPAAATILGAALASTDPVLLRGLLRRRDVPTAARQGLRLESGLNDVVLLPIVLVGMALLNNDPQHATNWGRMALDLFLLGPGAGVVVGVLSVATLDLIRRRIGIRRDYESLYALGVAFTAFSAAEAVHGSGFLAAFAAGMTITALDVELCDCFLEYGETTAELALLFTFVLFGSSLIWTGLTGLSIATLLFAFFALLIRPPIYRLALAPARLDHTSRRIIAWFGPRGLSSLLLVLLPIFAGLPGSEQLFPLCCLVVLLSVVLHGGAPMLIGRAPTQRAPKQAEGGTLDGVPPITAEATAETPDPDTADESKEQPSTTWVPTDGAEGEMLPLLDERAAEPRAEGEDAVDADRISIAALRQLVRRGEPVVILDARTERSYGASDLQARGAVRLPPDHIAERAAELELPRRAWLVAFCA